MRTLAPCLALLSGCGAVAIHVAAPARSDGTMAAAFALPSHLGGTVTLGDALATGPAMLIFYRGAW